MAKDIISQAKEELRAISENALKLINQTAGENARLLAVAIADASKISNGNNSGDHDFLLTFSSEVKSELKNIRTDIQKLSDGTAKRIEDLEIGKLDIADSYVSVYKNEQDKRIEAIEKSTVLLVSSRNTTTVLLTIGSSLISLMATLLIIHMFK